LSASPLTVYVHEPAPTGDTLIVAPDMTALAIPAHVEVP
jgi:hypothetical protein